MSRRKQSCEEARRPRVHWNKTEAATSEWHNPPSQLVVVIARLPIFVLASLTIEMRLQNKYGYAGSSCYGALKECIA